MTICYNNFMANFLIPQDRLKYAKLYSSRDEFIKTLPKGITFLEAGVLAGDFSAKVIEVCSPSKSILIDPYQSLDWNAAEYHESRWHGPEQHFNFVKQRFSNITTVELFQGKYEDFALTNKDTFDFLYMDYDTSYTSIQHQIEISKSRLSIDGILGFNDYNIYENDTNIGKKQGTVHAINDFLYKNSDWYVYAFALNDNLTSDIYLKKLT